MLCKFIKGEKYWRILIVIGFISILFGIISKGMIPKNIHNLSMFSGMITGLGGAFLGIGAYKLIGLRTKSQKRLKEEEIELNDERNIQILRISYTVANVTATVILVIMSFVFVFIDYIIPAFISIAGIYIQLMAFLLAYKHYSKKM